jgi:hypothetical protein
MTASVSKRMVDRLDWRVQKYYDMPLLIVSHAMDPTDKGVCLRTGCNDPASWASVMDFLMYYGRVFGYDVGESLEDSNGEETTRCFMEHMATEVLGEERASNGGSVRYWSTALN